MLRGLLPKEFAFYDYFEKQADVLIKISEELLNLTNNFNDLGNIAQKIKAYEKELDNLTHQCIEALHRTFITPIERTEIYKLVKKLDDIADIINAAVKRIVLYEIKSIRPEVKEIANNLISATKEIRFALTLLRDLKHADKIRESCKKIQAFEQEADNLFRSTIPKLLKENDVIEILLWKEIFERFEKAADKCKDIASIIEEIVIENA